MLLLILIVLIREFESRRGEILNFFAKKKITAESVDGKTNTGVLRVEDIRFMSDLIMYDTSSERARNNING